jgi:S1-C subfamily serine protease
MKVFAVAALLVAFMAAPQPSYADEIDTLHEKLLYPVVRVRTDQAGGSGTVIYSEDRDEAGTFRTYALTNYHVIDDAISVTKKWDNLSQRWTVQENNKLVDVELFSWHKGKIIDRKVVKAAVVAHSKDDDIALLELRSGVDFYPLRVSTVAQLATDEEVANLRVFQKIYAVGCSLGHEPIHSTGELTDLDDLQNGKTYMMGSAPIIFGNSGGAVFTQIEGEYRLVGIPSLVAVTWGGAVSHMNWFVPQSRIEIFLRDAKLDFFFDETRTPSQCFEDRAKARSSVEIKDEYPEESSTTESLSETTCVPAL